jgi:hypothetical protein
LICTKKEFIFVTVERIICNIYEKRRNQMPKYTCFGQLKFYYFMDVQADNRQHALEIAQELTNRFNIDDTAVDIPLLDGNRIAIDVIDDESEIELSEDENNTMELPP